MKRKKSIFVYILLLSIFLISFPTTNVRGWSFYKGLYEVERENLGVASDYRIALEIADTFRQDSLMGFKYGKVFTKVKAKKMYKSPEFSPIREKILEELGKTEPKIIWKYDRDYDHYRMHYEFSEKSGVYFLFKKVKGKALYKLYGGGFVFIGITEPSVKEDPITGQLKVYGLSERASLEFARLSLLVLSEGKPEDERRDDLDTPILNDISTSDDEVSLLSIYATPKVIYMINLYIDSFSIKMSLTDVLFMGECPYHFKLIAVSRKQKNTFVNCLKKRLKNRKYGYIKF